MREWAIPDPLLRYAKKGRIMMGRFVLFLYILAAFFGLWVVAKWLGIIINIGFLIFMAFMLISVIALGVVS